jgi:tetratricopeptide (TPR) repeat protein
MVIDNADDAELFSPNSQKRDMLSGESQATQISNNLARYIPDCNHGSILVTTRNKKAGLKLCPNKSPIEVSNMTESECHDLMQKILSDQQLSNDKTSLLSLRLEYLPLALTQAASFIQENCISINAYVQLLDESDSAFVDQLSEPFETTGRDSETPHAVTATWIISFEQIERQQALTSDILSFLSLFHFQAIPKEFVEDYCQRRDLKQIEGNTSAIMMKALGTLKAFCLVSEGKDKTITMHRLVQLVMRKWLINRGKMTKFTEYAIETMSATYPYGIFETHDTCMRYLPHANSVLIQDKANLSNKNIAKALLLHNMAGYFNYKGEWKEAEELWVQVMEIRKRVLGAEHPDTLTGIGNLALTYWNQGRWKEAEDLEVQVMEIRKRVLGAEHPDTLTNISNLALIYQKQGRWKEAEELQVQEMEISKRVLGAEHLDTLTSIGNLALTYSNQGRWKEAEELQVQVMEIRKRVLGAEHPGTLTSIGNLALTYWNQGRWKEAEELQVQVMEIRKRVLGAEHPGTLTSIGNLALTYRDQGRWKEAEELQVQVMEIRKRVLGAEHPGTLTSMANLAFIWKDLERLSDAIALMEKCASIRKRRLGRTHPDTIFSLSTLDEWRSI